jgi:hypothetical protein
MFPKRKIKVRDLSIRNRGNPPNPEIRPKLDRGRVVLLGIVPGNSKEDAAIVV